MPDWTAGPGTDASNHADVGPGTGADGDPEAGGDPAMVADHSAEPSDSAAATPIPSGLDLAASGVRRGASGHDPADFASRLAQAADNAAIGATGHAPAASVTLGTPYPGTAASAGSTPVHVGSIATPLSDPAFAGHLAGETLKLAIAGVEHAQISVQPKDLGPIRIELSLNGESARIAFSATQPDTRQAIEQSLPILEDMLAEHGLLLADANVSDQRGGDAEGGKHAGRAPGADPDSSPKRGYGASGIDEIGSREADGAAPVPLIRRGLVDLYA
ncbi:MAG TPA: flagellar hook-length control protein FliK [Burkholderiaceae bacterium]|nr:flagellar hook-length control protein FliK [Burkholderiaceae bacterium]